MTERALDHVNVVVQDLERSLAFYCDCLGLVPVMDRVLDGVWFERLTGLADASARCVILESPGGGCRVELLKYQTPCSGGPDVTGPAALGLRHFAIRIADVDAVVERIRAATGQTATVVDVPTDIVRGGKRMAYVRDPDGALVELSQYGERNPFLNP